MIDVAAIHDEFTGRRPAGGYRAILADPPWLYKNWSEKGSERGALAQYDCMTIADIKKLPVEALAAPDCALFIWCTWPLMPVWNDVITEWGFSFAGLAWEWIKFNPETGRYRFGMGYGTRKNLEPCLLATHGNPKMRSDTTFFGTNHRPQGVRSVRDFIEAMPLDALRAPAREHSRKPDEQYDRIETMFDGPRIELFARQARPGWQRWGNQIDKFSKEPPA